MCLSDADDNGGGDGNSTIVDLEGLQVVFQRRPFSVSV